MNTCPHHKIRDGLSPLTDRLAKLPVDERGYPVPWFVSWIDGKPEFRAADARKWVRAVNERLCWCCGERLGVHLAFVIGPMCAINRTTAEPPTHLECAAWSVKGCPFLSKPQMVRREDKAYAKMCAENDVGVAGIMIERNPGVSLIWVTRKYTIFRDHQNQPLIEVGKPEYTSWWAFGRPATRAEVMASIESGLPKLLELCQDQDDRDELFRRRDNLNSILPKV